MPRTARAVGDSGICHVMLWGSPTKDIRRRRVMLTENRLLFALFLNPSIEMIYEQLKRYLKPVFFYKRIVFTGKMERGLTLTHDSYMYTSRLGVKFWVEYIQTEPGVIRYLYLRQEDEKQQEEETKNEWEKTKDYVANALVITGFIAAAGGGLVYYTADICDSILNKYH